jgi:spermidine synthase
VPDEPSGAPGDPPGDEAGGGDAGTAVIDVVTDPGRPSGRMVTLDGIPCSFVDLDDPSHLEFEYVRRFGDAVDLVAPDGEPLDVVHLGGGGCTLPRYVAATRPGSRQVVYETDRRLIDLARHELGLRTSTLLRVREADARAGLLGRAAASADVVVGDAFDGAEVPAHLRTVEFLSEVRQVLRPAGMYLLNVIDRPPLAAARQHAATLLSVFRQVAMVAETPILHGRRRGNLVFLASRRPLPVAALATVVARAPFPERALDRPAVAAFAAGYPPYQDGGGARHDPDHRDGHAVRTGRRERDGHGGRSRRRT